MNLKELACLGFGALGVAVGVAEHVEHRKTVQKIDNAIRDIRAKTDIEIQQDLVNRAIDKHAAEAVRRNERIAVANSVERIVNADREKISKEASEHLEKVLNTIDDNEVKRDVVSSSVDKISAKIVDRFANGFLSSTGGSSDRYQVVRDALKMVQEKPSDYYTYSLASDVINKFGKE